LPACLPQLQDNLFCARELFLSTLYLQSFGRADCFIGDWSLCRYMGCQVLIGTRGSCSSQGRPIARDMAASRIVLWKEAPFSETPIKHRSLICTSMHASHAPLPSEVLMDVH
jgi:hypothetical protein